jgi:hypothetical protein
MQQGWKISMLALASQCNSSNDVAFCRSYIMGKFTGPKSAAHELHSDYENFTEKTRTICISNPLTGC